MNRLLDEIIAQKRREAAVLPALQPAPNPALRRDFTARLAAPGLSVIAEIKRRSPSRGVLRDPLDPAALARQYQQAGAAALSVLTDERFFGGSDSDLRTARAACGLPALRKDFIVDARQIEQAAAIGADAILLIVRILSDTELLELSARAEQLGLAALVETHSHAEIERAVACGAKIIGVNARDLDTFDVDLAGALALRDHIPSGVLTVAESGIHTRDDARRVEQAGFDAMLVGEGLITAPDPGARLRELIGP